MMDEALPEPAPQPRPSGLVARVWAVVYLGLFAVLAYDMFTGLRMRCEGFGCMGVGVFWVVWAGGYGVVGLLGHWARAITRRAGVAVGSVRLAGWAQLAMGAVVLIAWWRAT